MIINHNITAMNANRNLGRANQAGAENMAKLSSGLRINKASDDASGLGVSEKMRSQIRGLNQGSRNIQDAVSFMQTTEGYLEESTQALQRIRELSVQAANGIYTSEDRSLINVELEQMIDEVDRIASHAQFNGMNMLTGRFAENDLNPASGSEISFHVGANMDQNVSASIGTMTASSLGLREMATGANSISISTAETANRTIGVVDKALSRVIDQRAQLGAYQNRLELANEGITVAAENMQAAESRIRDLDVASESISFAKNQILTQAGTSMLAQANARSQGVLQLLQ